MQQTMLRQVNKPGHATGRYYHSTVKSIIRGMKYQDARAVNIPLHNPCVWFKSGGNLRVNFTDTRFTYSTFTLLSASAHLCPFSCSPRPSTSTRSTTIHALCLHPPPLLTWAFIYLPHYFLCHSLKLILPLPIPWPSSSLPRPLVVTLACDTCGKLLRGPRFG